MTAQERAALWEALTQNALAADIAAGTIGGDYTSPDHAYKRGRAAFGFARVAIDAYEALLADDVQEGETPIARLERERHDNDLLISALAKEKAHVEMVMRVEGQRIAARDKEIADLQIERSLADKATVAARADRDRFQRELAITQEKLELALAGTNLDDAGLTAVIESIAERAMTAVASVAKEQIAEAQAALVSERAKRCGTCRWWGSDPRTTAIERGCSNDHSSCSYVSAVWPADHGCPHHERKDGAA